MCTFTPPHLPLWNSDEKTGLKVAYVNKDSVFSGTTRIAVLKNTFLPGVILELTIAR